jgi:hypothetical protein
MAGIGVETAIGAGASVLGMVSNLGAGERQQRRTKELMDIQQRNQKDLNNQGVENSMKLWNATSYPEQIRKMKEGGLNIGMMYGGVGSGGTTSGTNGGSASGGQGASDIPVQSGMGMELGMYAKQQQLMDAQIAKTNAETENVKATTTGKGLENNWETFIQGKDTNEGSDGTPLKERGMRLEQNKTIGTIQTIARNLEKIGVDINKGQSEIERIKTDTGLQKQMMEMREQTNPIEIERLTKELEVYKNNPANNEIVLWIVTGKLCLNMGGPSSKAKYY